MAFKKQKAWPLKPQRDDSPKTFACYSEHESYLSLFQPPQILDTIFFPAKHEEAQSFSYPAERVKTLSPRQQCRKVLVERCCENGIRWGSLCPLSFKLGLCDVLRKRVPIGVGGEV